MNWYFHVENKVKNYCCSLERSDEEINDNDDRLNRITVEKKINKNDIARVDGLLIIYSLR